MAFRTIVIDKATKINLDLNNIVVKYDDESFWISLDEISNIIITDPRCLVSLKLLTELCEKGINLLFTNSSHMPVGALTTLNNNARSSKRIASQILWQAETKEFLWTKILKRKIASQIDTLELLDKTEKKEVLAELLATLESNDPKNREGTASRVYFKALFGPDFKRFNEDIINYVLNYVYQIIRAKIAQEIVAAGYSPNLGICHKSEYNHFNLADDFIEVFRPIVDYFAYKILEKAEADYLTPELKNEIINIVNERIIYNDSKQKIHVVIQYYVQNMLSFLETGDVSKIVFPELIWIV